MSELIGLAANTLLSTSDQLFCRQKGFQAQTTIARDGGTGQIRGKVKEDENGIEIADARSFEFGGRRGSEAANK